MLGVGHVTVGRRISLLEKRLGVTLLHRTPDGFAVTAAGDAVLRQCIAMENAALDLERVAAGRDSLAAGSVRLTTTEGSFPDFPCSKAITLRLTHTAIRRRFGYGLQSPLDGGSALRDHFLRGAPTRKFWPRGNHFRCLTHKLGPMLVEIVLSQHGNLAGREMLWLQSLGAKCE